MIVAPKKGTPEWYKWLVEKLSKDAGRNIAIIAEFDQSLMVDLQIKAQAEVQRALIKLLVEQGVIKKVEKIVIPRGGG